MPRKVSTRKRTRKQPKYFSREEIARIFDKIEEMGNRKGYKLGYRNKVAAKTAYMLALRASEATGIWIKNIHWDDGFFLVKCKGDKGSELTEVPLPDALKREWLHYIEHYNIKSGKLFNIMRGMFWKIIADARDELGIDSHIPEGERKRAAHAFRHSFGHHYLDENPGDFNGLRQLMRHTDIDVTQIYTEKSTADLKKTLDGYYGKVSDLER